MSAHERGHRRRHALGAPLVLAIALATLAPSDAGAVSGIGRAAVFAQVVEILVPDTRWEICHGTCDQVHRAVLSWPVSVYFHRANLGGGKLSLVNRPFVEPQLRLVANNFRFAFGHRIGLWRRRLGTGWLNALGVFVEGGGLLAKGDGNGGFVGGGIGLGGLGQSWLLDTVSLVYRHAWTSVEARHDLTLDVVIVVF